MCPEEPWDADDFETQSQSWDPEDDLDLEDEGVVSV